MTRCAHTTAENLHLTKVAALGCLCCLVDGRPYTPANIHHIREGYGMGQRASHFEVLPLCKGHHQGDDDRTKVAFHQSPEGWRRQYGSEIEQVRLINRFIVQLDAQQPLWWEFAPEVLGGEISV